MTYIKVFCMCIMALSLTACAKSTPVDNEIVRNYIQEKDKEFDRVKEKESEDFLRVYDVGDNCYSFITGVRGYEEMIYMDVVAREKAIEDVVIIYENESDGYGSYITEEWFLERFEIEGYDKLLLSKYMREEENEVIAVTGATFSSQVVLNGINDILNTIGDN